MSRRILLLTLTLSLVNGWSQPQPQDCQSLRKRLDAFLAKYNPYRSGGPKATLKTVEDELGKPQIEPGNDSGTSHAVYALDGCVGRVLIDSNGVAWMTKFATVSVVTTPQVGALEQLEQLQGVENRLRELRTQLEVLEALKSALVKQSSELPPTPPQAQRQNSVSAPTGDADSVYAAGHFEEAAQAYTKVLGVSPANGETLLRRGYCYHKLGRLKDAIQDYGESIRLAPTPIAYNNRALAYLATGQTEQARADFQQAKAIGAAAPITNTTPSSGSSVSGKGGPVSVKGYTRKDGTYVAPHTRSAPRKR